MTSMDPTTTVARYSAALHAQVASLMCDLADVLNGRTPPRPTDSDALLRAVVAAADMIDTGATEASKLDAFAANLDKISSVEHGTEAIGDGWSVRPIRPETGPRRLRIDTTSDLTPEASRALSNAISKALNETEHEE